MLVFWGGAWPSRSLWEAVLDIAVVVRVAVGYGCLCDMRFRVGEDVAGEKKLCVSKHHSDLWL